MANRITHVNPDGMHKHPAFSQMVITEGTGKTIYIGGQNAVNEKGEIVGKGDIAAQTGQVMKNLLTALAAAGATMDNVVKLTIFILQGVDVVAGFQASQPFMSKTAPPPAISGVLVAGLTHPDYLVEIEAVAFV